MRSLLFAGIAGSLLLTPSYAENLFDNGSFELPLITGRTDVQKGGNPSQGAGKTSWTSLLVKTTKDGSGVISGGLTDEIARTGKQSLYVDFEKLTQIRASVSLHSELIPIQPEQKYRLSLWGRTDKKRPLAMDERRPHLMVEFEFFAEDQETQLENTEYRAQMLPGSVVPGLKPRLLFVSGQWNEFSTLFKSPQQATFVKFVIRFESGTEKGETDGLLFLDDAILDGEKGKVPLRNLEEKEESTAEAPASPSDPTSTPDKPAVK